MKARWVEALALISKGNSISQTAKRMGVSVQMVNVHLARARLKLKAKNTVEAACKAVKSGIICFLAAAMISNEAGQAFLSSDAGVNPYAPMSDIELFRRAKVKRRRDDVLQRDDIALV